MDRRSLQGAAVDEGQVKLSSIEGCQASRFGQDNVQPGESRAANGWANHDAGKDPSSMAATDAEIDQRNLQCGLDKQCI